LATGPPATTETPHTRQMSPLNCLQCHDPLHASHEFKRKRKSKKVSIKKPITSKQIEYTTERTKPKLFSSSFYLWAKHLDRLSIPPNSLKRSVNENNPNKTPIEKGNSAGPGHAESPVLLLPYSTRCHIKTETANQNRLLNLSNLLITLIPMRYDHSCLSFGIDGVLEQAISGLPRIFLQPDCNLLILPGSHTL